MARISFKYETCTCSRCGGTGSYSWNAQDGSRCFKCKGAKVAMTKLGAKAYETVEAKRKELFEVSAREIKAGDQVWVSLGIGAVNKWHTVLAANITEERDYQFGDQTIHQNAKLTMEFKNCSYTIEAAWMVRRWTPEASAALIEFAKTVKGVEVIES